MATIINDNKRETWIDIARLLCMLFVIIGHTPLYEEEIRDYLSTFHVGIFFILSGYLYHPKDFKTEFKRSFVSLVIPYIILGMINCIFWCAFDYHFEKLPVAVGIKTYTQQLLETSIGLPMIGPLWFLIVLFLIRCIMVFPRNIIQLSTVCLVSIGIAYLTNIYFQDSLLYAPICLFLALPFFIFGYAMQLLKDLVYKTLNMQIIHKLSATLIFFILSVTLFSYQGESNMSKHDYGNNIIAFYICAIFGIMSVIVFSSLFKVKNKKCLYHLQIANNGLPLMIGLQIILINAIKHIIGIYAFHIFGATILSMGIMVVTYPLTVISIKYFPIVLGKRQ